MRPLIALEHAVTASLVSNRYNKRGKYAKTPGAVIQNMGQEAREALSRLTSDELVAIRIDPNELGDDAYFADQEVRKLKIAFDLGCKR